MKNIIEFVLILVFLTSCSKDQSTSPDNLSNSFVEMIEHYPNQFYVIDVKTKYSDKFSETGLKNGTIMYINNTNWGKVKETGENYSLWIKDISRIESDSLTTITFNLELQEPSLAFEGKVYKKKHFVINYSRDIYNDKLENNINAQSVSARYKIYAEKCKKTGEISAFINNSLIAKSPNPYTFICSKILDMFLTEMQNEKTQQCQQFEAVICGAECFGELKEWLFLHEQGNF
ncbi:MAG: hypothetical protein NTW25_14015 [Candidatus Kapabacteria bacterium]|nr:hypothetical protein [Candidatus Kapabacteria bacterium]